MQDNQIQLISIPPSHPPDIHTNHTYLGSFVWIGFFSGHFLEGEAIWEYRKQHQQSQQGMKELKHSCSNLLPQTSPEQLV